MATHSSVLAWRIPGTGEPDGLLSMGSHRVRHDWSDLAATAAIVLTIFCLFCVFIVFFPPSVSAYLSKFMVFYLVWCAVSPCLYLLCIYFRFLVCGYHESYIRYLIDKAVRFKLISFSCLQKFYPLLLPFYTFDVTIDLFCIVHLLTNCNSCNCF